MKTPMYTVIVAPTQLTWIFPGPSGVHNDRQEFETARCLNACPSCGKTMTLTALPEPLKAIQPDNTTHVCFPGAGGCNQGFEVEGE